MEVAKQAFAAESEQSNRSMSSSLASADGAGLVDLVLTGTISEKELEKLSADDHLSLLSLEFCDCILYIFSIKLFAAAAFRRASSVGACSPGAGL